MLLRKWLLASIGKYSTLIKYKKFHLLIYNVLYIHKYHYLFLLFKTNVVLAIDIVSNEENRYEIDKKKIKLKGRERKIKNRNFQRSCAKKPAHKKPVRFFSSPSMYSPSVRCIPLPSSSFSLSLAPPLALRRLVGRRRPKPGAGAGAFAGLFAGDEHPPGTSTPSLPFPYAV
jgi:hypothetical protein